MAVKLFALIAVLAPLAASAVEPCRIEVVEKGSGWPVPLVELRTTHNARFVTDNAGVVAFDLPELMGRETWLGVSGHGYEVPKDGFGYRGVRLTPEPGKTLRVEVRRTIVAKRLGRLTGGGLFAERQRLGRELDWREPRLLGCDSVQNAVHRGKLFWAWGDTTLARYPLGIFHMTSATTAVQPLASFEPPVRLRFDHFRDANGTPRAVAKMPGSGPTWVSAYVALPDKSGASRLVATYVKIKPPLEAYECGLCVWDDAAARFERLKVVWTKSDATPKRPPVPDGHPAFWTDAQGQRWVLFGNPLPTLRCPATFEAWQDPSTWEALTPQKSLASAADGKPVKPHTGSIAWNAFRKRWVTVFMQAFGKPSVFGELWYAEAHVPTGPWGKAVKVLSHDNYTFYNPRLHPEFTPAGSRILIFEGTYTQQFADRPRPTPRYDYNQILYRLDLDDPLLKPAQTEEPKAARLPPVRLSDDKRGFALAGTNRPFRPRGFNYDHDAAGRLLEDYWLDEWPTVVDDFKEMKALGANVVRIHLQVARFMRGPRQPDRAALRQLARLVALAETTGLYLDITGLGCYHKKDVPAWYSAMAEADHWAVQARFWEAIARTCAESPAVFCYDLMNEPVLPGGGPKEKEWLLGELGGKHFVQRITLDLAGRTKEQVARAWVDTLAGAIRKHDSQHLVTVGVIPWAHVFPKARPLFYAPEVGGSLDFVSVHFYPAKGKVQDALRALAAYNVGKPIVVEEMFPLKCSVEELDAFVEGSRKVAAGYLGFYWGKAIDEYARGEATIAAAMTKRWLEYFRSKSQQQAPAPATAGLGN